jgi:pimeloyl-ACP methyl ester carboxylesterase
VARFVEANGLRFAYRTWGQEDGSIALLVHGFPDTPATWRHLGPSLAAAGFRVIAPWTRGYAPTGIPRDHDYSTDVLAADLNRLHDVLGGDDDAVLIGHDWGAIATYAAVAAAPGRWRRAVTLAVPPEPALAGLLTRPRQLRRSWYTVAAQFPVERLAARNDFAAIVRLWRAWSPGYEPQPEDLDPLRSTLRSPGSLRAALGYFRDKVREGLTGRYPRRHGPVPTRPTLYLHGADDGCMLVEWADVAARVLRAAEPASRAEVVPGVGHFLHLEAPDTIAGHVLDWVTTE